jgi:hypothetical protein
MFETSINHHACSEIYSNLPISPEIKRSRKLDPLDEAIHQLLSRPYSSSPIFSWFVSTLRQFNDHRLVSKIQRCVRVFESQCLDSSSSFLSFLRRLARAIGRRIKLHSGSGKSRCCFLFGPKNFQKSLHVNTISQIVSMTPDKTPVSFYLAASFNLSIHDLETSFKHPHHLLDTTEARIETPHPPVDQLNNLNLSADLSEGTTNDSTHSESSFELPSISESSLLMTSNFLLIEAQLTEIFQDRRERGIVAQKVAPSFRGGLDSNFILF